MAETAEKAPSIAEGFAGLSSEQVVNALMDSMSSPAKTQPTTPVAKVETTVVAKEAPVTSKTDDKTIADKSSAEKPVNNKEATDKIVAEKAVEGKGEAENKLAADKLDADKAKNPEQIASDKLAEEDAVPVLEFKLPDTQSKDGESTIEANGWKDLAKEFEIEITEDKFEEFKEKLDAHYKNKYEPNLGKYNAETQAIFEYLEAGGTIEQYVKPTEGIDRLIALDDEAIVTAELKASNFPEDKIEKEVARLIEVDQLDLYAIKVRQSLTAKKAEIQSNIIQSKTNAIKRQDTYKNNINTEQSASIKKALNTVSEFMETPLKAEVKDFITAKEQKGEYATIFNDPKVKAEFLLWYEFGKAATTNLKNKASHEALMKYKADRHNIPPKTEVGGTGVRSTSQTTTKAEGNWAALEGFTSL